MTAEPQGRLSQRLARSGAVEASLIGAAGAGAVLTSIAAAPGWSGAAGAMLAGLMLAIAVIDHRRMIIPDELNALAFIVGLVAAGVGTEGPPVAALLQALVRASLMFILFFGFRAGFRALARSGGDGLRRRQAGRSRGRVAGLGFLPVAMKSRRCPRSPVLYSRFRGHGFDPKARLPFGAFFAPAIWICWALTTWRCDWAPL